MGLSKDILLTIKDYEVKLDKDIKFYEYDTINLCFSIMEYGIVVKNGVSVNKLMPIQALKAYMLIETPDKKDYAEATEIEDNKVVFNLGNRYSRFIGVGRMQIVIKDADGCRITLPEFPFEIKESINTGWDDVIDFLETEHDVIIGDELGRPIETTKISEMDETDEITPQTYTMVINEDGNKKIKLDTIMESVNETIESNVEEIDKKIDEMIEVYDDEEVEVEFPSLHNDVERIRDEMNEISESLDNIESEVNNVHISLNSIVHSIENYKRLDNETDDTGRINRAIQVLKENGGGTLYLPYTYYTSENIKLPPYINLKGENRFTSKIIRTASGDSPTCIIEIVDYNGAYKYGEISNLTLETDGSNIDCGIGAEKPAQFLKVVNVDIANTDYGIKLNEGTWLCTMSNLQLYGNNIGLALLNNSTSCSFSNIYVMGAKSKGYEFEGVTYSSFDTLCADFCKGVVYDFNFGTCVLNGCGAESIEATNIVKINNQANVTFNNSTLFNPTPENSTMLDVLDGNLIMNACSLGHSDTPALGNLFNVGSTSFLTLNNTKLNTRFEKNSVNNGYVNKDNIKMTSSSVFLGADGVGLDSKIDEYNKDKNIHTKMIVLNNQDSPNTSSNGSSREWSKPYSKGDVFFMDSPIKNGWGGAISLYSPRIEKQIKGTIEQIVSSTTVKLTTLDLEDTSSTGLQLIPGMKLEFSSGFTGVITYVNYTERTVQLWSPSGTPTVGATGKLIPQQYASANQYAYIPIIHSGITAQRPISKVTGQQFYDTTLGKPIWWNGTKWVDVNGVGV